MKVKFCSIVGVIGSSVMAFVDKGGAALETLVIFMIIDYITGISVAVFWRRSGKTKRGLLKSEAGLVREYLDTLLPEKWDDMDLFERRNFLHGEDFGNPDLKGTVRRMCVSNMEIWCECFGKERANLL